MSASHEQIGRWLDEQMFEEDIRAVMSMLRPHRRERLAGWEEHRTGGSWFRATISWDPEVTRDREDRQRWQVPRIAEVLEAVLVGSARNGDELTPQEEFALYRGVAEELRRRLDELEECYT